MPPEVKVAQAVTGDCEQGERSLPQEHDLPRHRLPTRLQPHEVRSAGDAVAGMVAGGPDRDTSPALLHGPRTLLSQRVASIAQLEVTSTARAVCIRQPCLASTLKEEVKKVPFRPGNVPDFKLKARVFSSAYEIETTESP